MFCKAPDEGKKPRGQEGEFFIPSPLMGEGEDEGDITCFKPSLRGDQPFFGWTTW